MELAIVSDLFTNNTNERYLTDEIRNFEHRYLCENKLLTTKVKYLTADQLEHMGLFFLQKLFPDGVIPSVNLVCFAWENIVKIAKEKNLAVF